MSSKELDAQSLFRMMLGFQTTQVLYAASTLGIFEELHAGRGALSAVEVANNLHTNPDATLRLMNTCAGLGILRKANSTSGTDTFENTTVIERFLVKSSPMNMSTMLSNIGGDLYPLWGKLREGVQQGHSQLSQTEFGGNGNIFEPGNGFYSNRTKQTEFMEVMHIFSSLDAPAVLNEFDLTEFKTICDLGGGTGALAVQIARRYPESSVSVVDLEHVVDCAHQFMPKDKPRNVVFQSGDFFKDNLPEADLYILSHVLHDWNDDSIDLLLSKVYSSLKSGGAVLVLEKFLNETKDGPIDALMFDMGMLIGADGRERTSKEYLELLEGHGFTDCDVRILQKAKWHDGILTRKY